MTPNFFEKKKKKKVLAYKYFFKIQWHKEKTFKLLQYNQTQYNMEIN